MDSRATQSHAHEYDEKYHHNQQVSHGEEDHHHDHEKKSVLKKVKAKAKKIKDKVTKHGHHDHEHGHDQYHYEDQHIPDDHDLDEEDDDDEEMVHDPEVHGAPIYDSATVKGGTPGQAQNLGRHGPNFGGSTVLAEPPHHNPRVIVVSPTTGIGQSRVNDPARTFVGDDMRVHDKVNLVRPMGLEEDPHAPRSTPVSHDPANYQTKVTDPTRAGGAEVDITPIQSSLAHMALHNEPKPNLEPKILPTIAETQHTLINESHHHFVPELSTATKTQYPSAQTHDHNMPQLSSEIKTQYPRSHDQLMPDLHISNKTHYPSTTTHDQNLPGLSSATQSHYPSALSHDEFMPDLHGSTKSHYPSAISHDQNLPGLSSATKTHYPSAGSHDQFKPDLHGSTRSHYPSAVSHDQNMPDLLSANKTHYPSISHDQNLPQLSSGAKTHYPSAGSHDSGLFSTEPKNQYSSAKGHHDQDLSHMSSATKTQYPSVGSHDQFVPDWPTQTKPHYHSSENQAQFMTEPIPLSTNTYSQTPEPTTTRFQEQPHYESMEKPSNERSYTDKISSATSAIADKAVTAKNAVADKLGYGEKDYDKETRFHEDNRTGEKAPNQSSYTEKISSATSAIADKAVSAKNTVASKLGYGEKGDNADNKVTTSTTKHVEEKRDNADNSTTNTASEYGKNIALSLTEKLAPVYGKVAGVGSAVKSKLPGTEKESVGVEQDRGVSVKDYLVDKLRPSEEDKALSEVITESLHKKEEEPREVRDVKNVISDAVHKREEEKPEIRERHRPLGKVTESEEVKMRLGTDEKAERRYEDIYVNSPGTGVVDKLKNVVGSWFGGNPEENQSSQVAGGEDLSKKSGSGVEHVGARRLQDSSH
ncbi:PREDICTED: low-temperature-induced 78 kDa protein-like isoform X2 [Lupinus angustifolius]|uniref:low-temperature-induced 78 kDa protein-like isoform X1 n=1 Tax=Lupinus angustifolius TaxID=3871 RepID=UPI00092F75A8|nr:PREDICTED: low-temperature-induced 78 kDa protein-like isoform X1 [Lupinus angustifolius]XP_019453881.1 PREDICTED: low-temperature-induced 78 kDa protein-like isoform X2 [Lupinus angustifolius]